MTPDGYFFRKLKAVVRFISAILGVLAIVSLVQRGFDVVLVGFVEALIEGYELLLAGLLGWAEPYIRALLALIGQYFAIDLTLHPHWRDIAVLLGVYFLQDAGASAGIGRPGGVVFLSSIGFPLALITGVGAGCVAPLRDFESTFALVAIAVIGTTLYDSAKLLWYAGSLRAWSAERNGVQVEDYRPYLLSRVKYPVSTLLVGLSVAVIAPLIPAVAALPIPRVAIVLFLVVLMMLYWLYVGAQRAEGMRKGNDTWADGFLKTGPGLLGLAMLAAFLGAALALVVNAANQALSV